jgi:hypothetical protein
LGLDAHPVIDRIAEFLVASAIAPGGLDGDVPKQELDVIHFATGEVAQSGATTPEVVRVSQFLLASQPP